MKYQFTNRVGWMDMDALREEIRPGLKGLTSLVCGGRDFEDYHSLKFTLNILDPVLVIQGGCEGPDLMSKRWAEARGVHCAQVDALWDYYDKPAGPLRNDAMLLLRPGYVVALPGGPGTADMVKKSRRAGVPVLMCKEVA